MEVYRTVGNNHEMQGLYRHKKEALNSCMTCIYKKIEASHANETRVLYNCGNLKPAP